MTEQKSEAHLVTVGSVILETNDRDSRDLRNNIQ